MSSQLNGLPIDTSTPIFVLRRSFAKLQHGVLGVARSAGRLGIPVYAVQMDRGEAATSSRYLRRALTLGSALPASSANDEAWLEAMLELGPELGHPLLVPIDDVSAVFVGDHRTALASGFLLPPQPEGVERRLAGRRDLTETCRQLGIPVPRAVYPQDEDAAVEQAAGLSYPVVLKQCKPWILSETDEVPSVLIAHTEAQLIASFRWMRGPASSEVMLQEYIPGDSTTVWMFNGYFGEASRCLSSFTGRKLRQRGPRTGPTTLGICAYNESIAGSAQRLLEALGYRGIVDMGFRYDERDGAYKLLDANPRLGSTFRLFASENGIDVLRAQYLDLTGQRVPEASCPEGRKWLVEPHDLVVAAQLAHEGELSAAGWLRSLQGVEETAWWASDDPRPFLAMCTALGRELPDYIARRRARKRLIGVNGASPDAV